MAALTKTIGDVLNAGLKEIGDPEITALDSDNILQLRLIEVANNAVQELTDLGDFEWRLQRTILVTNSDITTESAAVTLDSTTVTSVTDAGVSAANWTDATNSMWFRVTSKQKSYKISSTSLSGTPHTLTLETAYLDATSTASGYRIFQDTYPISTTGFGELAQASYGDAGSWQAGMSGRLSDSRLLIKSLSDLMAICGGDRHRDTSGKPRIITQIGANSSGYPEFILWPYPTSAYLIELWYDIEFSAATAFDTVLFGTDAPSSAYTFVEHKVVAGAHLWNEDVSKTTIYEQLASKALANVLRRENRAQKDVGFDVETYRRSYGNRIRGRSSIAFDTYRRR